MHSPIVAHAVLLLNYFSIVTAGKGKPGGSTPSSSDSSSNNNNNNNNNNHGGGGAGGGSPPGVSVQPYPITPPPCALTDCTCNQERERASLYELPGLYYNGTITIVHQLDYNSARNKTSAATANGQRCENSDDSRKEYKYPALFTVGPPGNQSDTNPIFWSLRGLEPAEANRNQETNPFKTWVHLRSADFVVTSNQYNNIVGQDAYKSSDATGRFSDTSVYWNTTVTSSSGSGSGPVYAAIANYIAQPPEDKLYLGQSYGPPVGGRPRSSQFVTLSDVCYLRHIGWHGSVSIPPSYIPSGNRNLWTTTPTLFLEPGASATVDGIGSNTLQFNLNYGFPKRLPFVGQDLSRCQYNDGNRFKDTFMLLADADSSQSGGEAFWILRGTVELRFEGTLVADKSTIINGSRNGVPTFNASYQRKDLSATTNSSLRSTGSKEYPLLFSFSFAMLVSMATFASVMAPSLY